MRAGILGPLYSDAPLRPRPRGLRPHLAPGTTPHFTVVTDAGEKQARHVAGQFERMQAVFHKILPATRSDPGAPIVVLALKNKRDFQTVEPPTTSPKASLTSPASSSKATTAATSSSVSTPVVITPTPASTSTPTTSPAAMPTLPRLNEGIAESHQNTDIDSREIRFGQPSAADIHLLRSQSLLPLPTLFTVDHDSPYYHDEQKGTMFYSESWALTYMLYINDFRNKTNLISNYLKALSAGQTSLTAAVTTFGDL